jgi:negative regulator of sigma-B (phosphoserine phosphatase)
MKSRLLEVGIAQRISPGEELSGDRCFVQQSGNRALLGVIDGLGHGAAAANAAEAAGAVLEGPAPLPVSALMQRCHERLRDTRGAALTLMEFNIAVWQLQWTGVGNITAVLLHPEPFGKLCRTELFVRGGVAGVRLPSTVAYSARIALGDMVVAATDGVRSSFAWDINRIEPPQQLADRLLARHHNGYDDALVVVARIQRGAA